MKKSRLLLLSQIALLALLMAMTSCSKDDDVKVPEEEEESSIPKNVLTVNNFVHDAMQDAYLWTDFLPDIDQTKEPDSEEYFYKLLYKDDRWSWIVDDYDALINSFKGISKSMGHDFQLFQLEDKSIIGIITYVNPDTPASRANLKRSDVFTKIDGNDMTPENYRELLSKDSYTLTMATIVNKVVTEDGRQISLIAEETHTNPIFISKVLEVEGQKVGYLMYTQYIADYNDQLTAEFEKFKAAGVTDLVLDLRYNGGGDLSAATHLCSLIAPSAVATQEEVFIKYIWNDNYQAYFKSTEGEESPNLVVRFKNIAANIDLQKVYVITTKGTASASEQTINGLNPYMDVVTVGETTHGKYTGSITLSDTHKPKVHNWAIQPIVMKAANSEGFTDFKDGMAPDFEVEDDLTNPLGSVEEGMLAKALEKITGVPVSATKAAKAYQALYKKPLKPFGKRNIMYDSRIKLDR